MPSWVDAIVPFFIAIAVVIGPGLLVVSAGGARGWLRWAIASPVTFSVAGLGAVLLGLLRIPFTPVSFTVGLLVLATVVWFARRLITKRRSSDRGSAEIAHKGEAVDVSPWVKRTAVVVGVGLAATLISTRLMLGIGSPTAIAQLFDNVFHLNAIGLIHTSGNGSSLSLGNLTEASRGFYPAAFHDVVAIVMGLGVTDVSVALNVVSIVLAAVVWPLSLTFLTTRIFGNRPDVIIISGICATLFAAFPYRLFSFGVLYPFMSGLTMMPVLVALILEFFRAGRSSVRGQLAFATALVAAAPGIALTHPSVVVAGLLLAVPFAFPAVSRLRQERESTAARAQAAIAVAYLLGTAASFLIVRPPLSTAPWDPIQDPRAAVGSIVLMSPGTGLIGWVLIPLAACGAIHAVRHARSHATVLTMAAIGSTLYFASAAMWHPLVRDLLAGVWYRDTERVSALFAIACLPLVILGAKTITDALISLAGRVAPKSAVSVRNITVLVLVGIAIIVVGQRGALAQAESWLGQSFGQAGVEPLLSADERTLLEELPDIVPPDEVVVGDASTGASLTLAFSGRDALTPHIFGERSRDEKVLLTRWDRVGVDPAVCEVVRELDAYWALDFGTEGVLGEERPNIYGLDRLADAPGIAEVARVGDAVLYEAVACR